MRVQILAFAALAGLAACAHAPDAPSGPADYTAVASEPSSKARFYADCIAQAAASMMYGRAHDDDTELVLFICSGAPARAFYDALATRSAEVGSEILIDGLTYRSTNPVRRDLFGVDYCHTDGRDYACVVSLNAGEFLRP